MPKQFKTNVFQNGIFSSRLVTIKTDWGDNLQLSVVNNNETQSRNSRAVALSTHAFTIQFILELAPRSLWLMILTNFWLLIYREQMLESLLEASRHLLVPEMSQNKAVAIARQVVGSLLQVRLEQHSRSNHNRPKGVLGSILLGVDFPTVLSEPYYLPFSHTL